jgi:hypothetical protein
MVKGLAHPEKSISATNGMKMFFVISLRSPMAADIPLLRLQVRMRRELIVHVGRNTVMGFTRGLHGIHVDGRLRQVS